MLRAVRQDFKYIWPWPLIPRSYQRSETVGVTFLYLHIIRKHCPICIIDQARCLIVSIPNRSHFHCATCTYEHSQSNQIKEEFSLLAVRQILCDLDIWVIVMIGNIQIIGNHCAKYDRSRSKDERGVRVTRKTDNRRADWQTDGHDWLQYIRI